MYRASLLRCTAQLALDTVPVVYSRRSTHFECRWQVRSVQGVNPGGVTSGDDGLQLPLLCCQLDPPGGYRSLMVYR